MLLINHHHLYYFWIAAKQKSIGRACEALHLAQPTVSAQIIKLEKELKKRLFIRQKRGLELTEDGRLVFDYAEQIFNLSQELVDAVSDRPSQHRLRVQMAVVDQVSKEVSLQLLETLFQRNPTIQATVHEGRLDHLLPQLANHSLDLVLSDTDIPVSESNEYLKIEIGRLPVVLVGSPKLAAKVKRFPQDLAHVPLLLPTRESPISASVERYLHEAGIPTTVRAEIEEADVLRRLSLEGHGVAPLDQLTADAGIRAKRLIQLNPTPLGINQRYWLIMRKRHRQNPAAADLFKTFRLSSVGTSLKRHRSV